MLLRSLTAMPLGAWSAHTGHSFFPEALFVQLSDLRVLIKRYCGGGRKGTALGEDEVLINTLVDMGGLLSEEKPICFAPVPP